MTGREKSSQENVLVCVLKDRRDSKLLFKEQWYRIPKKHLPRRRFKYLAFYQPTSFGRQGERISYYARVLGKNTLFRNKLLPQEAGHIRAEEEYIRIQIGRPSKLSRPLCNTSPRRVSFGFTSLARLLSAKNILQLYGVPETEKITGLNLGRANIRVAPQYWVTGSGKKYRLDFAVFCKRGKIAIECDNAKAHSGRRQTERDKEKDSFLRRLGWRVVRLKEKDIVGKSGYVNEIKKLVRRLGGQADKMLSRF